MHSLLLATRKGLFVAEPTGGAYAIDRGHFVGHNQSPAMVASTDRGESWSVASNYLPPVYAVTFA